MIVRRGNALTEPGLQTEPSMARTGRRRTRRSPRSHAVVYRTRMRARLVVLATLFVIAACAPRTSGREPARPAAVAPAAAADSLRGPWRVRNPARPRAAVVELRAELRSTIDTLSRTDTVASRTWLEWSSVPGSEPQRLVGMVRDFAVQTGDDGAWAPVPGLGFPITFAALVDAPGEQPRLESPNPAGCDARAAAVQALRDAWLAPPQALAIGTAWEDSATYTVCRDGVLLRASGGRGYVVDGAELRDDRLVLRVLRVSDVQIEGRGVQFGDSVAVTGRSTSQGMLFLSLDGGAIVSGNIRSELRLEMRGRRRTQQLVQDGVLEIRVP